MGHRFSTEQTGRRLRSVAMSAKTAADMADALYAEVYCLRLLGQADLHAAQGAVHPLRCLLVTAGKRQTFQRSVESQSPAPLHATSNFYAWTGAQRLKNVHLRPQLYVVVLLQEYGGSVGFFLHFMLITYAFVLAATLLLKRGILSVANKSSFRPWKVIL